MISERREKIRLMAHSCLEGSRTVIAALLVLLFVFTCPLGAQEASEVFNAWGFDQNRKYFSQLPYEHIDPMTGNLLLTFTDLVLPGNAGFDLSIQRTYNSKIYWNYPSRVIKEDSWAGVGWTMYIARVINPVLSAVIEMSDGSSHPTYSHVDQSGRRITKEYWIYEYRNSPVLQLPNGVKYTFDYFLTVPTLGPVAYATKIEDPFGNEIEIEYGNGAHAPFDGITKITQKFGTQSRVVRFEYDDDVHRSLKKMILMSGTTHTWTYVQTQAVSNFNQTLLKEVKPPVGPSWKYDYATTQGSLNEELTKVTTPTGGTIEYKYADKLFYMPGTSALTRSRSVVQRTTGGRDIPSGTWTYNYTLGRDKNQSEIISPCDKTTYTFMGIGQSGIGLPAWQTGLLASKVVREGSTVLEIETFEWLPSVPISFEEVLIGNNHDPDVYVPLVKKLTVTRGNRNYTTINTYSNQNFNDYGRPHTIQESGELTRTIRRTFQYGFQPYIVDKIASETVTVGGESFTKSFEYNLFNGFKKSETIYGIRTEYFEDTGGHSKGNIKAFKDANGNVTNFTYRWGVLKNTTTPEYAIQRSIHPSGTVSWVKQRGHTTNFVYDKQFRIIKIDPPVGDDYIIEYDNARGTFFRVKRGPSSRTTKLDGLGRTSGTENGVGVKTEVDYDACGRTTYKSYPCTGNNNIGTTFDYDAIGRIKEKRNPDNSKMTYSYYNGIDVDIRDEKFKLTKQDWSAFGDPNDERLIQLTDANNHTWSYAYNALGSLQSVKPARGPRRTWIYNNKNQLIRETHPENGTVNYTYDAVGNLKTRDDPAFGRTTFTYDRNNRLIHIDRPGTTYDTHLDYDDSDNLTLSENEYVKSTFDYDPADRLILRTDVVSSKPFIMRYNYDGRDNITRIDYPSGLVVVYGYDSENRILSVTDGARSTYASNFTYHPSGAIASYRAGNGLNHTFTYDNRYRVKDIFDSGGVLNLKYSYDNVGNVTQIRDARPGMNQSYDYDHLHRLIKANGTWGVGSFDYDALGNRTRKTISGAGTNYSYDASTNRLTSASGAEANTFTYDANGNLKTSKTGSFAYTPENMLETATVADAVTTYRYDGDNLRKLKQAEGKTQYYLHGPGDQILSEFEVSSDQQLQPVRDYIYAGIRLIASVNNRLESPTARANSRSPAARIQHHASAQTPCPPTEAPTPNGPSGTISNPKPTFSWSAVNGASSYTLYVLKVSDESVVLRQTGITGTSFTPGASLPERIDLRWKVKGESSCGPGPYSPSIFFKVSQVPCPPTEAPTPSGPSGTISNSRPSFSWSAVDGASSYTLYVLKVSDESVVLRQTGITGTSFTPGASLPERIDLRWKVKGESSCGPGPYSPSIFFKVSQVPCPPTEAPTPSGPSGTISNSRPSFSWSAVDGASSYTLYVLKVSDESVVLRQTGITGTSFIPGFSLPEGIDLRWKVKGESSCGPGPFSPSVSFTIQSLVGTKQLEYYHLDAIGSVRAVTDRDRAVIERHDYLPFGREWEKQPSSNPIRFTGKERDQESGLDYFGARYYGAEISRFTTIDPAMTIDPNLVDPQRWNRYTYSRNNPIRYADPDGKEIMDMISGAADAFGSNFWLGQGRVQANNSDFAFGQSIGDVASIGFGAIETLAGLKLLALGTGGTGLGILATGTGGGAVIGVPSTVGGVVVAVGGVGMAVHGTFVSATGLQNLINSFSKGRPGSNISQNKQFGDAAREAGLKKGTEEWDRAHKELTQISREGESFDYKELVELLKGFVKKQKNR